MAPQLFRDRFYARSEIARTDQALTKRWLEQDHGGMGRIDSTGCDLDLFLNSREKLISIAFKGIQGGVYHPFVGDLVTLSADKPRPYLRVAWIDRWIIAHLGRLYGEALESQLDSSVFSFRSGIGQHDAVRSVCSFLTGRRCTEVFRTDIAGFGESLEHTELQRDFHDVVSTSPDLERLFAVLLRYPMKIEGRAATMCRGLIMGSHLQLVAENAYMRHLDVTLSLLAENGSGRGVYARYGDDLIFAHEDGERVVKSKVEICEFVARRGLTLNTSKTHHIMLRPDPQSLTASTRLGEEKRVTHRQNVRYLGRIITWAGRDFLPSEKERVVVELLVRGLKCVADRLPVSTTPAERVAKLCHSLQEMVLNLSTLAIEPAAEYLRSMRDEGQLRTLDERLNRSVLSLAYRRPFRKGFYRTFPPKRLREFGLESLVHLRRTERL